MTTSSFHAYKCRNVFKGRTINISTVKCKILRGMQNSGEQTEKNISNVVNDLQILGKLRVQMRCRQA
ncbi:hypothetical protein GIB67_034116, partial [Kingdonia uniflora]